MRHKRAIAILGAALTTFFANDPAIAGGTAASAVTNVLVLNAGGTNGAGVAFIYMAGAHTGAPPCHTQGARWAIDLGTPSGSATYATALAFHLSGRPLAVQGTNNCAAWGDTESVSYIIN